MWIFKVGKFECIDIWLVLFKRNKRNKIVRLFRIVIEFKKKKKKQRLLERNDKGQGKKCDRWNQNHCWKKKLPLESC